MRLRDLYEEAFPSTEWGYWITPLGGVYPVGSHGHDVFIRKEEGISSLTAMQRGWARINTISSFQLEACVDRLSSRTRSKVIALARDSDFHSFILDHHGDDGEVSQRFPVLHDFIHGFMALSQGALTENEDEEEEHFVMPTLWYHGTEADPHETAADFENNNLDPTGAAPSWQYWFSDDFDAVGYYGPNSVEAHLHISNPLIVTVAMQKAERIGTVSWANRAHQEGHDAVVILDIMDGDTISTVCAVFDPDQIEARANTIYDEETDETRKL